MEKKFDARLLGVIVLLVLGGVAAFFLFQPQKKSCPQGYVLENNECVKTVSPPGNRVTPGVGEVITGSFSEQYSQMSEKWQSLGLKESRFHKDYDALKSLASSKRIKLKEALTSFKDQSSEPAIKELAQLYLDMLFLAEKQSDLEVKLSGFNPEISDYCSQVSTLKGLNAELGELIEKSKALSNKISVFVSKYSVEAKKIDLNPMTSSFVSVEQVFSDQKNAIAMLEEACSS